MKKTLAVLALICASVFAHAQRVGINTTPDPTAALDVSAASKGLLVPRMTAAQRNNIATANSVSAPATGLVVYQTDGATGFYYYNGTAWVLLRDQVNTYPNVELSAAITSQQTIADKFGTNTFTTLGFQSTNANASLTGNNTWNGTTFTVGSGGAGWYQITGQFIGTAQNSNGVTNVGYQVVLDKNGAFGSPATAGTYPLAVSAYSSSTSSLLLKNGAPLQVTVYLAAGDYLNFRAQSYSTSVSAYTSSDGSSYATVVRLK